MLDQLLVMMLDSTRAGCVAQTRTEIAQLRVCDGRVSRAKYCAGRTCVWYFHGSSGCERATLASYKSTAERSISLPLCCAMSRRGASLIAASLLAAILTFSGEFPVPRVHAGVLGLTFRFLCAGMHTAASQQCMPGNATSSLFCTSSLSYNISSSTQVLIQVRRRIPICSSACLPARCCAVRSPRGVPFPGFACQADRRRRAQPDREHGCIRHAGMCKQVPVRAATRWRRRAQRWL